MSSCCRKAPVGAVMVMVTVWMFVLLAFAALAIGVGQLCAAKQHAQDTVDAAVMAGASAWRPYAYDPAHSTWLRDGSPAALADALEMTDIRDANDYNAALDLGPLDSSGTTRTADAASRTVTVHIGATVPCDTSTLLGGFLGAGGDVQVTAGSSAQITAEVFPWVIGDIREGVQHMPIRVNPAPFPPGEDVLFACGIPTGVDPEASLTDWVGKQIPPRDWGSFDQALLNWLADHSPCTIILPTRGPIAPACQGVATIIAESVDLGPPAVITCHRVANTEGTLLTQRHWRWSYRLHP